MSLDVYLESPPATVPCMCECGHEHTKDRSETLFWRNITHNLGRMAHEAGVYQYLWRPDEVEVTSASQLIEPLRVGIALLRSDPERFKAFNAANGWGLYEHLVEFIAAYLEACEQNPDALVRALR